MSEALNNIIEGAAATEVTERLTAPFLDRPTPSAPSRPVPSPSSAAAPSFPTPFRRDEQPAGQLDAGTASTMGMGVDSNISSDDGTFKLGAEDIQISTVRQASASDIKNMRDSYADKAAGKIFGFGQTYNKVTGTIDTKAPNFGMFGAPPLFGVLAAASSKYIQNRQNVAAQNAAAGMKDNGIVQINGMTVAVVDGKLYGNLPQGANYHDVKRIALDYINKRDPNDFAGTYARPAVTASDPGFDPSGKLARGYSYGQDDESDGGYSPGGRGGTPGGTGRGRSDYQGGYQGFSSSDDDPGYGGGGTSFDVGSFSFSGGGDRGFTGGFAAGGMAGNMQPPQQNAQPAGFVQGPPQQFSDSETVADDQPMQVQEGTFVINAPAVEFAGSDDIRRMILDAYSIAREKGLDIGGVDRTIYEESVDVALSKGEVVIPPALVKIIGLDRLQKINNRGKREVSRRQEKAADGGFIDGYAEGDLVNPTDVARVPVRGDEYMTQGIDSLTFLGTRVLGVSDDINRALAVAAEYDKKYKPRDDDRSRDTLRHILAAGYMDESKNNPASGFFGTVGNYIKGTGESIASSMFDRKEGSPETGMTAEDKIDLNNNQYGRALRKKFPKEEDFTRAAISVVESLRNGEAIELDGISPMMSYGRLPIPQN